MTDITSSAADSVRPLAVVTGGSTGIGYELGKLFAADGFDLIVAADTHLAEAKQALEGLGARVETLQADLSTEDGVQSLYDLVAGRPIDSLAAKTDSSTETRSKPRCRWCSSPDTN